LLILVDAKKRKRFLKSRGIADASPKECISVKFDEKRYQNKLKFLSKRTADIMYKDGVLHSLPQFLKDTGVLKSGRR